MNAVSLVSRGEMAVAVARALAEMAALEQEVDKLIRLNLENCHGVSDTAFDASSFSYAGAQNPIGRVRDFSKSRREEIACAGRKVSPAGLQNVVGWSIWQHLGRFSSEINPQAYTGRINSYFDKTATRNDQGLKAMEEVFEQVEQMDRNCAQKIEQALDLLKTARESLSENFVDLC
jgi:hypothetical protein